MAVSMKNSWPRRRTPTLRPVEDDFAGVAGAHDVEAFLKVPAGEAMGDNGADVEAGLEHDSHFVPGFVHFAAVDALDGEHVENHGVPVNGHGGGGDAQHRDAAAVS